MASLFCETRSTTRRSAAIAFLAALTLHVVADAQTPTQSDRERAGAAAKRTAERLRALQREADALAAQERTLLVELRKLEVDRQISVEQLVKSIDARRDLNAQLMGELQAAQQRLQASVAQMESGKGGALVLPLRPFQGDLPWPAKGTLLRRFGRQMNSRFGTSVVRNGIDLAVADGQPIRGIHEATVVYADQFAGYGNLVILITAGGRTRSTATSHRSTSAVASASTSRRCLAQLVVTPAATRRCTSSYGSTGTRSILYNG
jgi:septal ring factor EnvC (AmiA/AmiB activator)